MLRPLSRSGLLLFIVGVAAAATLPIRDVPYVAAGHVDALRAETAPVGLRFTDQTLGVRR
jgi:hypothetical protein